MADMEDRPSLAYGAWEAVWEPPARPSRAWLRRAFLDGVRWAAADWLRMMGANQDEELATAYARRLWEEDKRAKKGSPTPR